MKKTKVYNLLEYLSATLVISYFFIHDILLVITGITLSLYLININFINTFTRSLKINLMTEKANHELIKKDKDIKSDSINGKSMKENTQLTLAEKIEELGFIPSIDKTNDSTAA